MQVPSQLSQHDAHSLTKRLQTFVDTWKRVFLQLHSMYPPPGSPPPLPARVWKEWDVAADGSSAGSDQSVCVCSFNLLSNDLNEQYSFQFVSPHPSFGNFTLWDYRLPRCIEGPLCLQLDFAQPSKRNILCRDQP